MGRGFTSPAALVSALLLASVPARGQLSEQDKALRARQNARNFENNATVMALHDRTGKQVGQTFGERALYQEVVLSPDRTRVAVVKNDLENESAENGVRAGSDLVAGRQAVGVRADS